MLVVALPAVLFWRGFHLQVPILRISAWPFARSFAPGRIWFPSVPENMSVAEILRPVTGPERLCVPGKFRRIAGGPKPRHNIMCMRRFRVKLRLFSQQLFPRRGNRFPENAGTAALLFLWGKVLGDDSRFSRFPPLSRTFPGSPGEKKMQQGARNFMHLLYKALIFCI